MKGNNKLYTAWLLKIHPRHYFSQKSGRGVTRLNSAKGNLTGFTVIELLVVIALIGLLASIVLVSFNLPEKRYRATVAKSLEFSQSVQNAIGIDAAGWWNFDDEITDGKVTDTSGNGNTGNLCDSTGCGAGKGPTRTEDTPHKVAGTGGGKSALSFDGYRDQTVDYVSGGTNNIAGIANGTVDFWVKPLGRAVFPGNNQEGKVQFSSYRP